MADKHINYFALDKACEKKGCPLCSIIEERIEKYIDNMLFEHVSDRTFRRFFREAGGFCSAHSRKLDSFRDGLAVAILSRDVLENAMPYINKNKAPKYKCLCPACREQQHIEKEFLTFMCCLDTSEEEDKELIDKYLASEGLCFPHFLELLKVAKKIPGWLSDFEKGKIEKLLKRTADFIEFSAWGRQEDFKKLSAEDKVVWKEAARFIRGSGYHDGEQEEA